MGKRNLIDEVSINEMREMRELQGMSNQEIADALDVSYITVYKYIGKQPKEISARVRSEMNAPGVVIERRRTKDNTTFDSPAAPIEEEAPAACLFVQNSIVELVSAERTYFVDMKAATVEMDGGFKIDYDDLGAIIAELSAIHRKLGDSVRVPLEAW